MTDPREMAAIALETIAEQMEAQIEARYREREIELARRMYRRGYLAGRAAKQRGAPAVTNPETHARGELRELLNRKLAA